MKTIKYPGLVAEMARNGETQKTISKLINRSNANITKRFSGEVDWRISEIEKICKYFNKSYDELFKTE